MALRAAVARLKLRTSWFGTTWMRCSSVSNGDGSSSDRNVVDEVARRAMESAWEAEKEELRRLQEETREALDLIRSVDQEVEDQGGFPSLEEVLSRNMLEEEKSLRREKEKQMQEEIVKQRVRVVDEEGRANAVGRRKSSFANVVLWEGDGTYTINGMRFSEYFRCMNHREEVIKPFLATSSLGKFSMSATTRGGGLSGQAGAVRLGISRALQYYDPGFRPALKEEGLLTRDSRVVERKKPGKRKARKSPQWSKR